MEQTKFIYLVVDRNYLKKSFSTVRTIRFAKAYNNVMQALNYVMNINNDELMIVPILKDEYLELKERIERLCI